MSRFRRGPLMFFTGGASEGKCGPLPTPAVAPCQGRCCQKFCGLTGTRHVADKTSARMDCKVANTYPTTAASGAAAIIATDMRTERSPAKSGLHVNFIEKGEVKERREKFLTAKYGSHQMSLIRKRLAVEMWLYDELQKLYDSVGDKSKTSEVDVDIDELLDMDGDEQRRRHLQTLLVDAKKSPNDVKKFINDLLAKAKTL